MLNADVGRRRFLLAIFVVSGFTGLIYESIWTHYLKLFLGHAAYAQTVVLAIFMGGMAIGSGLVARYGARLRRLLWGYLIVEGVTGLLSVLFHRVFVALTDFSFAHVIPALPGAAAIGAYKWTLAALLILPQSVLLGMTFPLISGGIIRRWPERAGETLSVLYFTNSLGAAIGVLVSGFVLIGAFGLPGTIMTAGLLNVTLALAVWLLIRGQSEPAGEQRVEDSAPSMSAAQSVLGDPVARWFVLAATLTGAASFMYEIGWIRMLSLVLGSSTHSFELMLSAFIFGLAFGGLYVRRRIERITDPENYLGRIMLTMGALAALTLPAGNLMFNLMGWAVATLAHTAGGYLALNLVAQSIALLIMLPATFCAGMTLPVLTVALMRRGGGERAIGTIYSVNTLGAILGALLAVALMPWIGIKGVILGGATIHIGLGCSRLARAGWRPAPLAAMAVGIAVLTLTWLVGGLDPLRVASSVFRVGMATLPPGNAVTLIRDGRTATVTLSSIHGRISIATNGKADAAVQMDSGTPTPDEITMVLLAAIPLALHPDAVRVANIGFGSGMTSHVLLASPQLQRLDTIEIEPRMVEAARVGFGPRIHNVFEDARSHVVYDDAKTFFAAAREPYDLIVSEPSNPWVSGVASLFSDEFYGRVVPHLRPGGYFAQWLQIYETDVGVVASIAKALSRHFAHYAIYDLNDIDVLIIATPGPALAAPSDRIFQWPGLQAELDRIGVQSLADLRWRLIGDEHLLNPLFSVMAVPANSDFFPFVDLNAPRLRFLQATATELSGLTDLSAPVLEVLRGEAAGGTTAEPSRHSLMVRDRELRRALALRGALLSGHLQDLDAGTASAVLLLDLPGAACAEPVAQTAWKNAVRRVSELTASYLSAAELSAVSSRIAATPCYRGSADEPRAWADLLAAVAARDTPQVAVLGARLLQSSSLSDAESEYLVTVTATAYVRLGENAEAHDLLVKRWHSLEHSDARGLALTALAALSMPPRAGASTH